MREHPTLPNLGRVGVRAVVADAAVDDAASAAAAAPAAAALAECTAVLQGRYHAHDQGHRYLKSHMNSLSYKKYVTPLMPRNQPKMPPLVP